MEPGLLEEMTDCNTGAGKVKDDPGTCHAGRLRNSRRMMGMAKVHGIP